VGFVSANRSGDTRPAKADDISHSQCWEDPALLQAALHLGPEDDVLSVCGAGDNPFALAIAGARSVTIVDSSTPQIALAKLKLVAAQALDVERFRSFLGAGDIGQRVYLYHGLRAQMDDSSVAFWDQHEDWIRTGLLGCGAFEKSLTSFRSRVLPFVHRERTVGALLSMETLQEQRVFYDKQWNSRRWRGMFRLIPPPVLKPRGSGNDGSIASNRSAARKAFYQRMGRVLTEIPVRSNPFVQWGLSGQYRDMEQGPPYLSTEGHRRLVEVAERIRFVHEDLKGHLGTVGSGTYSAFNLSDAPAHLSATESEALLRGCVGAARSGARLAYWNHLEARHRPDTMADVLDRAEAVSAELSRQDRAFVHGGFQLETVR
jgi:S-adenosylmethionine-diacylglycerol 3-amino-3-carboxypropyl transferase